MAIHPTAIIDPRAEIDSTVDVGPYCVIDADVRIGAGCVLYHGVYVTGWTEVLEHCTLHPGVIVGHAPQDTKYTGARSYCRIGPRVTLREYVTIHRGTEPDSETVVGEGCFLLGGSHVGHNCRLGANVTLINNVLLGGHVVVGDHATFGGAAVVHQFVRVGAYAMIAGNARVTQDILPFALVSAEGKVSGLNRIGMRRAGFPRMEIAHVREAYRLLGMSGATREQVVDRLSMIDSHGIREILTPFLVEESRRGLAGRSRRRVRQDTVSAREDPM